MTKEELTKAIIGINKELDLLFREDYNSFLYGYLPEGKALELVRLLNNSSSYFCPNIDDEDLKLCVYDLMQNQFDLVSMLIDEFDHILPPRLKEAIIEHCAGLSKLILIIERENGELLDFNVSLRLLLDENNINPAI